MSTKTCVMRDAKIVFKPNFSGSKVGQSNPKKKNSDELDSSE